MYRQYFQDIERKNDGERLPLGEVIHHLAFNDDGLIPVVTQDEETHTVLMMAWMNKASLEKTLETGLVTYWSRSRQSLWTKGESSGNTQQLVSMRFDCDGDCILCRVKQTGPACHTYRPHCFYLEVEPDARSVRVHGNGFETGGSKNENDGI